MKLKYLFSALLASSMLFAGCVKEESTTSFDNLKLDQTYLIASEEGGTLTLTVTATEEWKFVIDENWPDVVSFNKDADNKTIKAKHDRFGNLTNDPADIKEKKASWLVADKFEGPAGETVVTFTVPESKAGREIEIALYAGNNKQFVRVRQGSMAPVEKTCQEIKENANVGSSYITSGNVSRLGDYAKYGAFWIIDHTGVEVQVYGSTKESREAYPNVEVGDYVKFSGVWSSYGNFENAEISEHEKSLIKILTAAEMQPKEGGELVVTVAYKGKGAFPTIKEECQDWISYAGMEFKGGVPSKLEPSPADTAVVTFNVAENPGVLREGTIRFSSYDMDDDSREVSSGVDFVFQQKGAAEEVTVLELAETILETAGTETISYNVILTDAVVSYVSGGNVFIEDATGGILLYKSGHGLVAGNKITGVVSGKAKIYNGIPELTDIDYSGATVTTGATIPLTELTIEALLADYTRYLSCRVILKGVTIADPLNLSDRSGKITQSGAEINLYSQDKNSVVLAADAVGDLICYPTLYNTTKQVGVWQNSDFTATGAGNGETTPPAEGGDETTGLSEEVFMKNAGIANSVSIKDNPFTLGNLTFTYVDGGNTNEAKYYTSGEALRIYYPNAIKISSTKVITKLEIMPDTAANCVQNPTVDSGTIVVADGVATWTGEATSVTITPDKTKTSGNYRIVSVKAYYKE